MQHKLRYCFSLLKGDSYATMEPFLCPTGIDLATTAAFFAEITRIFGDSDEENTAARELEKLKQANRDFSRYYADFVRLATMIPDMSNKSKKRALKKGHSAELLDSLQYQDAPADETLSGFVDRLKQMDERIRRRKGQTTKPQNAPIAKPAPRTPSTATGTHPGPVDLPANKGHKLPADERVPHSARAMPVLWWSGPRGEWVPEEERLRCTPCRSNRRHRCRSCRRYSCRSRPRSRLRFGKRTSLELPGGTTLGCSLCFPLSSSSSSLLLPLKISALSLSPIEFNENILDGQHLVIPCTISVQFGEATVQTRALIDCGASGFSFVDEGFARHHSLPMTPLQQPRVVEVIDGRPISSGDIHYLA